MRSRTSLVIVVAATLGASTLARAQATCTAEGFVYDQQGNPLAGVKVLLDYKGHIPQKYRTKTDKSGRFVHVNVWEGPYDVTFSADGLGAVTVSDFPIRQIDAPDKPPTFRIGAPKAAAAPEEGASGEAGAPEGPSPAETAGALAAELDRGNAALAAGDVDEAVAAYEAVAAQAPELPQVHHNLGLAYKRQGELEKAKGAFSKAAELDPAFAEPHGALSVMLATAGEREEALAEAEKAVELAPDNTQYLYNLAVLYKDSSRPAEAEKAFLRLEEMEPGNAEIQFHLGTTLLALGRVPDAVARLERYVETAPTDAPNVASAKGMIDALRK